MRTSNRFAIAGIAVASALLSAGCREVTSVPERLSALYVLQNVNGMSLPATAAQGGGQQYVVLADSLAFDPSGQVRRSYTVRWISTSPRLVDTTYSQTLVLPYSIERNRVVIGFRGPCPANANCVGSEEGTIDGTAVRMIARLLWSGEPEFVFVRR